MLNFHGNGSETPAFFPFSPSFYFSVVHQCHPPPSCPRAIECPPGLSRFRPSSLLPAAIISSVRPTSFHLLDYRRVLFCPRKKAVFGDHFQLETEQCVNVFFIEKEGGQSSTRTRSKSVVSCYLCFDRSREKFSVNLCNQEGKWNKIDFFLSLLSLIRTKLYNSVQLFKFNEI